jgi:hypothetical protein
LKTGGTGRIVAGKREASVALQMKPACEKCGAPLAHEATDARICSYECTFCSSCAQSMHGRCPNCGGELVPRPRRNEVMEA